MARIDYWQYLLDSEGRPLQDAEVRVYLSGSNTEADIYLNATFGSVTKSSNELLKTNKYGFVQFWVGDEWEVEGGYDVDQQFRVVWQNTVDSIEEEIDNLYIFAPIRPIDTNENTISGDPSNKDLDKAISNKQGKKWNDHVDSIVPSASPHDIQPVIWYDTWDIKNKVVSNKLGYQMYEMADTALTTDVDVSAARFSSFSFGSLDLSGGLYYKDITHNYDNYYPIIKVNKNSNDNQVIPKKIQAINSNITRIWFDADLAIKVVAFG